MNFLLRHAACFVLAAAGLNSTSVACAREVEVAAELTTDAVLAASAWGMQRLAPKRARYVGDEFPTQGFDDRVHRQLHGRPTGPTPTAKEGRYRTFSNVAVVASAALPAAMAVAADDAATWGRVLTTGHALLLSNVFVTGLKHSVRRPRPEPRQEADRVATDDNAASFPSGHTSAAFVGATLVTRFFPQSSWWVKGGAFALAAATGLARIEGDKHFFTDVVVGGAIGAGSAVVADKWYEGDAPGLGVRATPTTVAATYTYYLGQQ